MKTGLVLSWRKILGQITDREKGTTTMGRSEPQYHLVESGLSKS